MNSEAIDLLEELQLRRWARMHYAAPDRRNTLHPVARDEMRTMDHESLEATDSEATVQNRNRNRMNQKLPRLLNPLSDQQYCRSQDTHVAVRGPRYLAAAAKRAGSAFAEDTPPAL